MPVAEIEGISTYYDVTGEGPPLLLLAPMGFNPSLSERRLNRIWRGFDPLDALSREFRLIVYDRRESGRSGGRVELLSWRLFARHAEGLLDHLDIDRAFLLAVGERARQSQIFWSATEAGPWSSVIASDEEFARSYVRQDLDRYLQVLAQSRDNLFSDTMPSGAGAEALMAMNVPAFIMPGDDAMHTTSCAHILRELIPHAQVSSLMPRQQNAASTAATIHA